MSSDYGRIGFAARFHNSRSGALRCPLTVVCGRQFQDLCSVRRRKDVHRNVRQGEWEIKTLKYGRRPIAVYVICWSSSLLQLHAIEAAPPRLEVSPSGRCLMWTLYSGPVWIYLFIYSITQSNATHCKQVYRHAWKMCVIVRARMCMCVCAWAHVCVCARACVRMWVYAPFASVCVCVYVFACVCVWVCVWGDVM